MHFIIKQGITIVTVVNITFVNDAFDSFVTKYLRYLQMMYVFALEQPRLNEMMTLVDLPVHYSDFQLNSNLQFKCLSLGRYDERYLNHKGLAQHC